MFGGKKRGDGMHFGPDGAVQIATGPDGFHTVINHGSVSTIMGQDGARTIFHNNGGGIVL